MEFQNLEELKKLRVVDLKERLAKLGKSTSGLKADLVDRLYNALAEKAGQVDLTAAAPSYVQMCNISAMEPDAPVVEVTIDTSQFDMSVQEPQIVTMGQYNVMASVPEMNVEIDQEQAFYQRQEETERLREQQEAMWRQQREEQLLRQQQDEAERYRQQQQYQRQEMERIQHEEAEAERLRLMQEEEMELRRQQEQKELERQEEERRRLLMEKEFQRRQEEDEFRRRQEEEYRLKQGEELRRKYEEEMERQCEEERQRQLEVERQRQLEEERRRQLEEERQRQLEEERQRKLEEERQRKLEEERQRKLEEERQRKLEEERQRQIEEERQRQLELERQMEIERKCQLELEHELEFERQRELELQRQKEIELQKQRELELEKERQRKFELERQREFELERQREFELERQRKLELKRQQELELEGQQQLELERLREIERQKELELERREVERQKELERIELERQNKLEQLRQKELEKEREAQLKRQRELEMEREAEFKRQREAELEKQRELDREKERWRQEEEEQRRQFEMKQQQKREEEEMYAMYEEEQRREQDEQLKRQEEFQRRQKEVLRDREEAMDEDVTVENADGEMGCENDVQKEKESFSNNSTSVIQHTANVSSSLKVSAGKDIHSFGSESETVTKSLEAINNEKNKENSIILTNNEVVSLLPSEQTPKVKLTKNQKRKLKKKRRQQNRREQLHLRASINYDDETNENHDDDVEVQYVGDKVELNPTDPMYHHFMKIFEAFKLTDPEQAKREAEEAALKAKLDAKKEPDLRKKPKDADEEPELEPKKDEQPKLSKRKLKQLTRLSIAELKQHVSRPDVVEMHDVTAKDPKLLVLLKSTRNTVPVPRHWCFKRKFLQGKRGIEKPPFNLPDFIKKTGIMEMRQALQEKEDQKTLKAKMREKVRPKMGKIDIDYQKLHDAFFKWQTKPKMTIHGDLYYEGKEYETRLKEKKPGELSDDLRTALGMPVGPGSQKVPPPWLIAMQRYGPPPSYPNLKIPGLNSPIPDGCSFGYHAGGWGKPPVDELGRPLYGDVFGTTSADYQQSMPEEEVDRSHWGELESESESESEVEEEEEEAGEGEEDIDKEGLATPAEGGLATPSGLSSVTMGMETPDMIELRKRKIESEMEAGENPSLYTVLPEKKPDRLGGVMMGSTHVYDLSAAMPQKVRTSVSHGGDSGVDVALDPSELDMDTATMTARYEQTLREQRSQLEKEDLSDMVAEHTAKQKSKRKRAAGQDVNRLAKKYKDFKF